MTYSGFRKPANGIIAAGIPHLVQDLKVETATNMYPGRWVTKGTNDDDIVVATAATAPIGMLGYEDAAEPYKPTDEDTAYGAGDWAPVLSGKGIVGVGSLTKGVKANKGDRLMVLAAGQLVPVVEFSGSLGIKVPFSNSEAAETDTYLDLPADVIVRDVLVDVGTAVDSSSIDIGILSSEDNGNADGFADGVSCATATMVRPGVTVTTGTTEVYYSANTRGALISSFNAGTDAADDNGVYAESIHVCDGTAKSVTYTTTNHAVAGYFYLIVEGAGVEVVAKAQETVDASSAAADILVEMV